MSDLSLDQKTKLLGLLCAAMDGREVRTHVQQFTGTDCLCVHSLLREVDALLRAQWTLEGQPEEEGILP